MSHEPRPPKADSFASPLPRSLGDKYTLLEEIGRGGMAAVYLALTRGLGASRVCAVKTVAYGPAEGDAQALSAKFLQEAATVSRLTHDNLVFVFDSGVVERELFLAMEFIEGKTLADVMAWSQSTQNTLSLGLAMFVTIEVLNGLAYVHSQGLVHRDVTPSNIMLSTSGAVKLLDFGLARPTQGSHQTGLGLKLGKPGYVAPEQFLGLEVDFRADLFSVGVMLWELLAGRPLLTPGTSRPRELAYVPPHEYRSGVPTELGEVLRIALADNPEDRFQSAQEFLDDISRYLAPGDYRKRLRTFMGETFGAELSAARDHREQLIAEANTLRPSPAPEPRNVGPMARLEDYVGAVLGDRYEVKRLIATGAMGAVYEGLHKGIDRRVAIKIYLFRGNRDLQARFVREAKAANRINDSHVVAVTDAGETPQGDAYVVMEYLEGQELAAYMKVRGTIPMDEALGIAAQIGRAMEAAHLAGVIHRDLKPANVMLVETREGQRVKVLDFGVARMMEQGDARVPIDGLTRPESALGTPHYMAPEQIVTGRNIDARTDIYAATTVLYEMLTGALPFDGETPEELCRAKLAVPAKDIRHSGISLPSGLCTLIMDSLSQDPDGRPSSAAAWRSRIESLRPERRRTTGTAPVIVSDVAKGRDVRRKVVPLVFLGLGLCASAYALFRDDSLPLPSTAVDTGIAPVAEDAAVLASQGSPDATAIAIAADTVGSEPPAASSAKPLIKRPTSAPVGNGSPSEVQALLSTAQQAFDEGRWLPSLLAATKAARLGGGAEAFILVGRANLGLGELESARAAFQTALVLSPGNEAAERGLRQSAK